MLLSHQREVAKDKTRRWGEEAALQAVFSVAHVVGMLMIFPGGLVYDRIGARAIGVLGALVAACGLTTIAQPDESAQVVCRAWHFRDLETER